MCMTSTRTIKGSGYASPSNLPYTEEECPVSACQLASTFGAATFSTTSSACGWQPTNSIPKVVSACSSPNSPPPKTKPSTKRSLEQMLSSNRRRRPRTLQDLPLPLRKRTCHTPKERFAAFVAILLMQLDAANGSTSTSTSSSSISNKSRIYKLSIQAKALVAECCRRNQMGDINFMPLQQSLSERLHGLVGDAVWDRARTFLHIYLMRHHGFQPGRDEEEEDLELLYRNSPVAQSRRRAGHGRCNSPAALHTATASPTTTSTPLEAV